MTPRRELAVERPVPARLLSTPMPQPARPAVRRVEYYQGPDCPTCGGGMTGTVCVYCAVDRARQDVDPGDVYELGHDALPAAVRAALAERQRAVVDAERAREAALPTDVRAELDARLAAIADGTHAAYRGRTPRL